MISTTDSTGSSRKKAWFGSIWRHISIQKNWSCTVRGTGYTSPTTEQLCISPSWMLNWHASWTRDLVDTTHPHSSTDSSSRRNTVEDQPRRRMVSFKYRYMKQEKHAAATSVPRTCRKRRCRKSPQTKRSMSGEAWNLPHMHERLTNGHLPTRPNLRLRLAQLEPARHRAGIKTMNMLSRTLMAQTLIRIKHAVVSSEIGIWWRRWTFRTLFEWTPNISRLRLSHSILHRLDGLWGDVLNKYFNPKSNSLYETYVFRQAKQVNNESLDHFVTRLRQLTQKCKFHDIDREILTQVIMNCASPRLRRQALCKGEDLTLQRLLEIGRSLEASEQQADALVCVFGGGLDWVPSIYWGLCCILPLRTIQNRTIQLVYSIW